MNASSFATPFGPIALIDAPNWRVVRSAQKQTILEFSIEIATKTSVARHHE